MNLNFGTFECVRGVAGKEREHIRDCVMIQRMLWPVNRNEAEMLD